VTRALLDGPGKLGAALGLSTAHSGLRLHLPEGAVPPGFDGLPMVRQPGTPVLLPRAGAVRLARGPRVGIDYALPEHRDAPWRIADAHSEWVGHRRGLVEDPP
jgi:DNA-3-methyladenine glycosylase